MEILLDLIQKIPRIKQKYFAGVYRNFYFLISRKACDNDMNLTGMAFMNNRAWNMNKLSDHGSTPYIG